MIMEHTASHRLESLSVARANLAEIEASLNTNWRHLDMYSLTLDFAAPNGDRLSLTRSSADNPEQLIERVTAVARIWCGGDMPAQASAAPETLAQAPAAPETPTEAPAAPETPTEAPAAPETPTEAPAAPKPRGRPRKTSETPTEAPAAPETPTEAPAAPETPTEAPAAPETPTTSIINDTMLGIYCARVAQSLTTPTGKGNVGAAAIFELAEIYVPQGSVPRPTNIATQEQRRAFVAKLAQFSGVAYHD